MGCIMSNRPPIHLLITDLDNTLYDWISSFVPAFYAMVDVASKILAVDQEQLLDELKEVHQRYRNSERPYALLETAIVQQRYANASWSERKNHLDGAFSAFNSQRERNLRLFPSVRETLQTIHRSGCTIVGYTEAFWENSLYRLILLKIVDEFRLLYAPKAREGIHPDLNPRHNLEEYITKLRFLPDNHRKPDPEILQEIAVVQGVSPENIIYVGDSITRDIAMAKLAGVRSVHARYGCNYSPVDWQKLVRITHWSDDDVARERRLKEEYRDIFPDLEIDSFSQLLTFYEFAPK